MLVQAISAVSGAAFGVAFSPVPIIAFLLVMMCDRAVTNGVTFLLGWALSTGVLVGIVIVAGSALGSSSVGAWIALVVGILFLYLGVTQAKKAVDERDHPTLPKWMAEVAEMSPWQTFTLAMVLNVTNPKNMGVIPAALDKLSPFELTTGQKWATLLAFCFIASLPLLVPLVYRLVAPDGSAHVFGQMSEFLTKYNHVILAVLFLFLGFNAATGAIPQLV